MSINPLFPERFMSQRLRPLRHLLLGCAAAALIADGAVERVVRQDEFEDGLVRFVDDGRGRADDHALGHRRAAGGLQLRHLLDLDEAHAAVGVRREFRVVTEMRDHHADLTRRFNDERALRDRDGLPVDRQPDCFD